MKVIKYLLSAILIIPALVLLVWGPSSNVAAPPGFVVVDYWEKWTADEEAAMRVIVNDFNNTVGKDKRIFVRYVSTSDVSQKTLVATAAGVPPDVAGLWDTNLTQFASQDALLPLDDMAAAAGINQSTYLPVFWNNCHYNGHLYALVSTPMAVALHYNTDEFREVGLDPDQPPRTIAELDHDAELLEKHSGHSLVRTGFLPTVPGWYVTSNYFWFGGSIWDSARHKFTLTDPKVVASFKWIQDYSKRLGGDAVNDFESSTGNFDSPQNPFLAGTLAMTQQGPWMAFYVLHLNPAMAGLRDMSDDDLSLPVEVRKKRLHWAAAAFPSVGTGPDFDNTTLCEFDTLCIPRGAKHPKEAFEFMSYVNTQPVMEKLCNLHCKNSPLQIVSDQFLNHHRNPYIQVFQDLSRSPNAHGTPQIPIFPEVDTEMTLLVQQMALLHGDPATSLAKLQVRLQKSYDAYMDKQQARATLAAGK